MAQKWYGNASQNKQQPQFSLGCFKPWRKYFCPGENPKILKKFGNCINFQPNTTLSQFFLADQKNHRKRDAKNTGKVAPQPTEHTPWTVGMPTLPRWTTSAGTLQWKPGFGLHLWLWVPQFFQHVTAPGLLDLLGLFPPHKNLGHEPSQACGRPTNKINWVSGRAQWDGHPLSPEWRDGGPRSHTTGPMEQKDTKQKAKRNSFDFWVRKLDPIWPYLT